MAIFYGPINFNRELVENYNTKSKYYLSGSEFLLCWDSKLYHASSDVGSLRQSSECPTRITDDARVGRREPQTAAKKLSHNIAKRLRMVEIHACMGSEYLELLNTWCNPPPSPK